ncbi:hypothetical protein GT037_001112 [Alternaria burnsii]|uniref:Uncharacterized protein n=1 Tax=Alternaria burnsii TaxID=1187904 RepID=A0A8H7BFH9_9PLEO|nr:uncharacterized protein GT037_001112 [Alternaria burnsii]KAF7682136.1 hypothetical protein GT037_001112 [Alternaria burnsii]CAI9636087.1 unnamed protein product [Alternaria burnsii]
MPIELAILHSILLLLKLLIILFWALCTRTVRSNIDTHATVMVSMQKVCVTYVAADCGSIIPGKSGAAAAFKAVKIHQKLLQAGIEVVDNGPLGYHDTSSQLDVLEETMTYQPSPFVPHDIRNRADNLELLRKVRRRMTKNFDQEPNAFQ